MFVPTATSYQRRPPFSLPRNSGAIVFRIPRTPENARPDNLTASDLDRQPHRSPKLGKSNALLQPRMNSNCNNRVDVPVRSIDRSWSTLALVASAAAHHVHQAHPVRIGSRQEGDRGRREGLRERGASGLQAQCKREGFHSNLHRALATERSSNPAGHAAASASRYWRRGCTVSASWQPRRVVDARMFSCIRSGRRYPDDANAIECTLYVGANRRWLDVIGWGG